MAFSPKSDMIIKDVRILDMNTGLTNELKSIRIINNQIVEIDEFERLKLDGVEVVIDGKGNYIMPGWVDMQAKMGKLLFINSLYNKYNP